MSASTRPATILSPYGEGYCKVCRFVEPLGPDGLIEEHFHSEQQATCKGSGTRPPAATPYRSALSAFRVTARKETCPECRRRVWVTPGDRPRFRRHTSFGDLYTLCPNSFRPVDK